MKRDLIGAKDKKIGEVVMDNDGNLSFTGMAIGMFDNLLERLGKEELGRRLMTEGWSNGYLYLGPVEEE